MPNRCPVVPAEWIEETCAEAFVDREVRHGCGLRIGHTGAHKCHCGHEPAMEALHEVSVDMTTDERSTIMDEPDVPGHILSAAARAALLSAAPNPGGLPRSLVHVFRWCCARATAVGRGWRDQVERVRS